YILADEPTGNLDSATTSEILLLLEQLHRQGKSIIMVTHEPEVGDRSNRIITLRDGEIHSDQRPRDRGLPLSAMNDPPHHQPPTPNP
ncbi:MAG: ABC transporter ATP-binding protein, partial [Pirellulales bacterium]|nr:ABC transporter ATP-binding protein [Pirellulales bacterium]